MTNPCENCTAFYPDCHPCAIKRAWVETGERDRAFAILLEIYNELKRAQGLHAPMQSKAHGYGVITEEYREYEREVFREKTERLTKPQITELTQLAAMCVRAMLDLGE